MEKIKLKNLNLLTISFILLFVISFASGCNDDGNAQQNETQFTESYSGTFVSASIVTDTNDDGFPANLGDFAGDSTFGSITIQSVNEYEPALENVTCAAEQIEFSLVQGNFVKRFENGDLIFGNWESGVSCFDTATKTSTATQTGSFTGGTGQFQNATGPVQINFNSNFIANNAEDGFSFGGAEGTGEGTVIFND